MGRTYLALIVLLLAAPAFAQEPVGCDKFKWPLVDRERAMLASPTAVASGSEVLQPLAAATMTQRNDGACHRRRSHAGLKMDVARVWLPACAGGTYSSGGRSSNCQYLPRAATKLRRACV